MHDVGSAKRRDASADAPRGAAASGSRTRAAAAVPVTAPPRSEVSSSTLRAVGALLALLRMGPLLILIVLVVLMANLSPFFATAQNLGNVLVQSAAIAILAIGQLLVILTRGIDLSVGSNLALSAVVGATVFGATGNAALTIASMPVPGSSVPLTDSDSCSGACPIRSSSLWRR